MLNEIMSLADVPEKLQQFISLVMEAAATCQDAEKAAALDAIDVTGREKAGEIVDDAAIVERLAREMARCAHAVKPDGDIFPEAYRRAFTEEFLRRNPDAKPYQSEVTESVRRWFRELERVMRDSYSKEGRVLLRHIIPILMDLEELKRGQAEIRALLRPNQDFTPSNQDYREIFEEPLFLHRGKNSEVCLRNLFVSHRFKIAEHKTEMRLSAESMDDCLARFVRDAEARFLFIEGDAGCGKSSLTAYLSYHCALHDRTAKDIFGDAQLITVRLRNIDVPTGEGSKCLKLGVLRFLYDDKEKDRKTLRRFRKSGARVLWLDGYDELCATDGIREPEAALRTLKDLDCKIIVTTRPTYIRFKDFDESYWRVKLEHFNGQQRRDWLARYAACGETLEEVNRQYLERIGEDETAGICDTPMGLYMVAAGHFTADALKNEWAVYHQIFNRELSETEYDKIFPNDFSRQHSVQEYQDLLYRVSEEIAWYLYQRNNENLWVLDGEIQRIIDELELNEDKRQVVERCYALCGYWKANTERGCVEFYHNNIRDFFLCEKLMRELNRAYEEHGDALRDERGDITPFLRRLCELFQYGKLENTVLFFIKQRAVYSDKKEPDWCADTEREERHTARIFETMLLRGDCYAACAGRLKTENPVKTVGRVLGNTIAVYRCLYESFLKPGERIRWWTDVIAVDEDRTLYRLADEILKDAGPSDLRNANLPGAYLYGADLRGVDLQGANLQGANLQDANLQDANLQGANLQGANLQNANLRGADLRGVDLQGADLQNANLQGAYLYGANLQGANLRGAKVLSADLQGVDLRGANLSVEELLLTMILRSAKLSNSKNLREKNVFVENLFNADL